jgi:hypothetical protein
MMQICRAQQNGVRMIHARAHRKLRGRQTRKTSWRDLVQAKNAIHGQAALSPKLKADPMMQQQTRFGLDMARSMQA